MSATQSEPVAPLVEHFFRREAGRLVSVLTLFDATPGEYYRRAGDPARAREHFEAARQKTNSSFDRQLIDRRLSSTS